MKDISLKYLKLVSILIFLGISNCMMVEDMISKNDAQSQIYFAANFKAKECNTPIPEPQLLVFSDQYKRNLDLCTIAITKMDCPFDGYPIICMGIYTNKETPSIPWYLNFKELTKTKFK
ncbi:MAG: hypothetical protein H7A24_03515 [Leptospiraceae bacterium]|nr:hypothetical protein [Leptospiraceae bacterium]MCP5510919.1 hypothetical protein [Leptospiraceae bacterium]